MTVFTEFFDLHSGGCKKTEHKIICIPAPEKEAIEIFIKRFGVDPTRSSCECCGSDFAIDEITREEIRNGSYVVHHV